jgi:hypothetical protein
MSPNTRRGGSSKSSVEGTLIALTIELTLSML